MDTETFVPLYKTLVRIHLDFASAVWSPYKQKHIEQIESVQRRATKTTSRAKRTIVFGTFKEIKATDTQLQKD